MYPTPAPRRRQAARSQLIRLLAERLVRDALAEVRSELATEQRDRAREREALAREAFRRSELERGAAPAPMRALVDDVTARYRRLVMQLQEVLSVEADRQRTRQILADLLGTVTIGRDEAGAYADLEEPAARLLLAAGGASPGMVAGAGFVYGSRRLYLTERKR